MTSKLSGSLYDVFTNFKIGPYHYYKDFISTIREVFERSKTWSQLFYENKVVRDERFKLTNILFKFCSKPRR